MTSSDRIEQLKQQVRTTSNQQRQLQAQKERVQETALGREKELQQNQREMTDLIRSVFGQSEMANAKERELLKDALDKFSYRQNVMNEQLIALNDNLTDTASLKAIYEAKRDQLEWNYHQQKNEYKRHLCELQDEISKHTDVLHDLKDNISTEQDKLADIVEETRRASFLKEFKKNWINKWFCIALVGFCAVVLGGIFGWGTYNVADALLSWIRGLFG